MGGERTACLCGKANVLLGSCTPVSATKCSGEGARQISGGVSCGLLVGLTGLRSLGMVCRNSAPVLLSLKVERQYPEPASTLLHCVIWSKITMSLQSSPCSLVLSKEVGWLD